jgi:hypothetical protein
MTTGGFAGGGGARVSVGGVGEGLVSSAKRRDALRCAHVIISPKNTFAKRRFCDIEITPFRWLANNLLLTILFI